MARIVRVNLLSTDLALLDKVRMLREAREKAGPGGRVEILALRADPIWQQLPRIEKEPEHVEHWTDKY